LIAKTPVDTMLTAATFGGQETASVTRAGVLVERRHVPALERGSAVLNFHHILAWENVPVVTEQSYNGRHATRTIKVPGTVSLGLAGDLVPVRFHSPFQVVACLIDPVQIAKVMAEQDHPSREPLHPHLLSEDDALATLVRLLMAEADIEGGSGRLYGESLALAITSRFVTNAQKLPLGPAEGVAHALSAVRLRRVVDLMTSDLSDDLSLETLAQESGYSRAHFLRMFRVATGSTPHRYLRERRLEYARDQLMSGGDSITEIAHAAGFSSHSHLTKLFHERFGATPSEFRRGN
jgi:AraC family transcriptional regulator